jgi:hypothetical protein
MARKLNEYKLVHTCVSHWKLIHLEYAQTNTSFVYPNENFPEHTCIKRFTDLPFIHVKTTHQSSLIPYPPHPHTRTSENHTSIEALGHIELLQENSQPTKNLIHEHQWLGDVLVITSHKIIIELNHSCAIIRCHKNQEQQKNGEEKNSWEIYTSSSSIKIVEDGSLFDIFTWPSFKPGSISAFQVKQKIHAPQTKQWTTTCYEFHHCRHMAMTNTYVPKKFTRKKENKIKLTNQDTMWILIRIRCKWIIGLFFL